MDFKAYDVSIIPIIMFITSICLKFGVPKKFAPIISGVLGLVFGIVYVAPGDILKGILSGLFMGASAVGFYSGSKNVYEELHKKKE